jgi:hypothetical protein
MLTSPPIDKYQGVSPLGHLMDGMTVAKFNPSPRVNADISRMYTKNSWAPPAFVERLAEGAGPVPQKIPRSGVGLSLRDGLISNKPLANPLPPNASPNAFDETQRKRYGEAERMVKMQRDLATRNSLTEGQRMTEMHMLRQAQESQRKHEMDLQALAATGITRNELQFDMAAAMNDIKYRERLMNTINVAGQGQGDALRMAATKYGIPLPPELGGLEKKNSNLAALKT